MYGFCVKEVVCKHFWQRFCSDKRTLLKKELDYLYIDHIVVDLFSFLHRADQTVSSG